MYIYIFFNLEKKEFEAKKQQRQMNICINNKNKLEVQMNKSHCLNLSFDQYT